MDGRGGVEGSSWEWEELGWSLQAHKPLSIEALQAWRKAEADLVAQRSHYEERYGTRSYLGQLDALAELVRSYSSHERGHGLFVFSLRS